ncbi:hypothetical protein [Salipaludibacillus sp. CF4.18]|uniref:hypothetical protein n=1 Tax=Salipaludibacillus sp. CF4.18 TaxID=3373081 RepID=UPI003EE553F1
MIKEWKVWIKISNCRIEKIDDETYRVPSFSDIKLINGKEYGAFDKFIETPSHMIDEENN